MCRAWDISMTKAREEGHSAGLKEGHSAGLREGHIAGQKEGISTAKAVFKAYLSGKNAEEIAKELKMPLEEVEEVLA